MHRIFNSLYGPVFLIWLLKPGEKAESKNCMEGQHPEKHLSVPERILEQPECDIQGDPAVRRIFGSSLACDAVRQRRHFCSLNAVDRGGSSLYCSKKLGCKEPDQARHP